MALPAVKHLDPVVGVDLHSVLVAPSPTPVFLPHPHIGFMLDLREYVNAALGVIGAIAFTIVEEKAVEYLKDHPDDAKKLDDTLKDASGELQKLAKDPTVAQALKGAKTAGDIANAMGAGVGMGSIAGRPIFVNGMLRATAGTHAFHAPALHFPLGESFAPPDPDPSNDAEAYMGSKTVLANNDPMAFLALPAMSCWALGLEPPTHNGAHTKREHLSLPTSFMLPIPTGRPVLVGGPPIVNMAALAKGLFKAFRGSEWAKTLADKLHLKSGFLRCKVLHAEPVDAIRGEVVVQQHDFTITGRLPLVWDRHYASHDMQDGAVGVGWRTLADVHLKLMRNSGTVGVAAYFSDHSTAFDTMPETVGIQTCVYDWQYGHALYRQDDRLVLRTYAGIEHEFVLPERWKHAVATLTEGAALILPIERMADLSGNAWTFERGPDRNLVRLVEWKSDGKTGRVIRCDPRSGSQIGSHSSLLATLTLIDTSGRIHPLVSYEHDRNGNLITVFDAMNHPHRFTYDDDHRMASHTSARGITFYYSHRHYDDDVWRVDHAWGESGLVDYRFDYDITHRETRITNSLGNQTILQANERGIPVARIDPLGNVTNYRYDARSRTSEKIDSAGRTTTWRYDEYGNLVTQTLPDGTAVYAQYNEFGKPICVTAPGDRQWHYAWDEHGNLLAQTTPIQTRMHYEYNWLGQLVRHTGPRGAVTRFDYDHDGNLAEVIDALGHRTRYTFDARANIIATVNALGHMSRYEYDRNGNLIRAIEQGERETSYSYDANGNLTRYRNPDGEVTQLEYSPLGHISTRLAPDGGVVEYRYDTEARLVGIVNERGQLHQIKRDPLGRIVEEVDYWGQPQRYEYGATGALLRSIDPLGQTIEYETDTLDRLVQKRMPDPRQPDAIRADFFSYDCHGNLIVAENPDSRIELAYDAVGRVTEERQGNDFVILHTYDAAGNRIERQTQLNVSGIVTTHTVRYGYNALDTVNSIQIDDAMPITFEHDPLGQVILEHLGAEMRREISYTSDGLLAKQTLLTGTSVLFASEYAYNANGEVIGKGDSRFGTEGYQYDPVGRLTAHLDPTGKLQEFAYDSAGDLLSIRTRNGPQRKIINIRGNRGNRILDEESNDPRWVYDQRGNLIWKRESQQDLALQWDAQGLLIESLATRPRSSDSEPGDGALNIRTQYIYDAFRRRLRKTTLAVHGAGTQATFQFATTARRSVSHFFWDGDALVAELAEGDGGHPAYRLPYGLMLDEDQAPRQPEGRVRKHQEWVYYPDTFVPLACVSDAEAANTRSKNWRNRRISYYRRDVNGCPTQMIDSNGREVWSTGISSGSTAPMNTNDYNPIRLQGQYWDVETGLHYNRHRYYDPFLGGFISKDPLGLAAGVNLYRYGPNSTVWTDPLGFRSSSAQPNNNFPWDLAHILGDLNRNNDPPLSGFHLNRPQRRRIRDWGAGPGEPKLYPVRVTPLGGPCLHGAYKGQIEIEVGNRWETVATNKSFFPDHWNAAELRRQLQSIDPHDPSKWHFDPMTRRFEGTTASGLRIAGYEDEWGGEYRPFPECH
ncbi:RHS repeat-associated core domain-containing protein [Burkholderia sp. Bp9031]|uniref:RHS repeat-associated core domain-containing protein n=1 Tax=Burkholderia sp. Bp9031 TaxID=2184566 RepID=UPI00163B22AF|nr:RHS repeat-associated core domain-containing protein [Burkholderia sp. Bp9031]